MKNWFSQNIKWVYAISIFVCISCYNPYLDFSVYSFFHPETSDHSKEDKIYFFTFYYLYGQDSYNYEPLKKDKDLVLDAWEEYFDYKIDRNILELNLYQDKKLKPFLEKQIRKVDKNALEYFNILLEFNTLADSTINDPWGEPKLIDTVSIRHMRRVVNKNLFSSKNEFLRERYFYLNIRTYVLEKNYQGLINFYDNNKNSIKNKTFISDWARSYYAGAFYHIGDYDKAYYEFAMVFAECPSRREVAVQSIKIYDIPYRETVINHCFTDEECINVHALNGLQTYADIASSIKFISDINPKHNLLPLLISRAINQQEHYYFKTKSEYEEYLDDISIEHRKIKQKNAPNQLLKIHKIVKKLLMHNNASDFYLLADSYLSSEIGDLTTAKTSLAKVQNTTNNPYIEKQSKALDLLFSLKSDLPYEESHFNKIFKDLKYLRSTEESIRDKSINVHLAKILNQYFLKLATKKTKRKSDKARIDYQSRGRIIFSELAIFDGGGPIGKKYILMDTLSLNDLKHAVDFMEKAQGIDLKLIELSGLGTDFFYLEYARKLMQHHDFRSAVEIFKKIDPSYVAMFLKLKDSYTSSNLWLKNQSKNQLTDPIKYVERLAKLQKTIKTDPKNVEALLQYAEALINISYHGRAWILSKSYKIYSEPYPWFENKKSHAYKNAQLLATNYYGLNEANKAINNALKYCKDPEICARIAYLGAMAEKGIYWFDESSINKITVYRDNTLENKRMKKLFNKRYRKKFNILKTKYSNTQYSKMLLKECDEFLFYNQSK